MRFSVRKSRNNTHSAEDSYAELRNKMVRKQIRNRGIANPRVLEVMRKVPRHRFVEPSFLGEAYADHALPMADNQTISQPYIVALMTELLELQPAFKVLEIGTGCGYQTAVLAEIVDQVYTVEIIENLAKDARRRLNTFGYQNIHLKIGNGYYGWQEHAPYDGILVAAAPKELPNRLINQLVNGGRLVLPIGAFNQELVLIQKTNRGIEQTVITGVRFVPMTGTNA
jgi:protein-L-isoaspartate(D-aspartate) O-methyltransferase